MNVCKLRALFEASTDKYGDAKKIGVTYETMRHILAGQDLKVSTLEKIAAFYNVPIGYFFDEASADGKPVSQIELEHLRGQIDGLREALRLVKGQS